MIIRTCGDKSAVIFGKDLDKVKEIVSLNKGFLMVHYIKTGTGMISQWTSFYELRELCRKGTMKIYNYAGRTSTDYSQVVKLKNIIIEYFDARSSTNVLNINTRILDIAKKLKLPPQDVIKYFDRHVG